MNSQAATPNKPAFPLQWSLQTLLLLTAAVAVWTGYLHYRREIPPLKQEIEAMQRMARELSIEDPQQASAVKLPEMWIDEHRWDVYLPEGAHVIRLATGEIGNEGLAPVTAEAPIDAGRHRIELRTDKEDDGVRITVLVDERTFLEATEKPGWYPGHGSEGTGDLMTSTQFPADEPVELHRRRFHEMTKTGQYTAPPEPTEGLLLWLEPVD